MSIRSAFAALLLCAAANPAYAQEVTADTLVAKNLAARGGADALAALKSVRFQGRLIFPGDFELAYKEVRARGADGHALSRSDLSLQGLDVVQAYDGAGGWKINPFQGRKDAERMSADEANSLADSSLIDGTLLAAKADGSRIAYLGREDFDGTLAYKLKVAQKDGDEFVYLLDPDTFLEIKVDETRKIRGAQTTTENELGDYEKVGGVYFPMSIESWGQGNSSQRSRLIIASSEANPAVDPAIFVEPKGPAAPASPSSSPKGE